MFAPILDLFQEPLWSRTYETFGEDPYVVAEMGRAVIEGIQGEDARFPKVGGWVGGRKEEGRSDLFVCLYVNPPTHLPYPFNRCPEPLPVWNPSSAMGILGMGTIGALLVPLSSTHPPTHPPIQGATSCGLYETLHRIRQQPAWTRSRPCGGER